MVFTFDDKIVLKYKKIWKDFWIKFCLSLDTIIGGFVTQSSIMKNQRLYFDEMEQHMSNETKQFYGNYFTRYTKYFSQASLSSDKSNEDNVKVLTNPRIYEIFDGALLDIYPSTTYRWFFLPIIFVQMLLMYVNKIIFFTFC